MKQGDYYHHGVGDVDRRTRIHCLPAVYFITTPDFAFIKVGKSGALKQRMNNIQSGCPFDLSLWQCIRTPKSKEVERDLHLKLMHCRLRGEWFSPNDADLDFILDYCAATNKSVREARSALLQA